VHERTHKVGAHGVAGPQGQAIAYGTSLVYEFGHAARVFAEAFGVDHPVEGSGQRLHGNPDLIAVAVDMDLLCHLGSTCNKANVSCEEHLQRVLPRRALPITRQLEWRKQAIQDITFHVYFKQTAHIYVRFEVFTTVTTKNVFFWDIKPSSYFTGDTLPLHYRVQQVNSM
jgi:hypothetical protein